MGNYALTKINEGDVCVEVGVWKGDLSAEILNHNPARLHLVDPWAHQDYIAMWYSAPQERMDQIFSEVEERFTLEGRVTIHREFSTEVFFPNDYFDWVYIDGNHTYEQVTKDLEFYFPLVKFGGKLCGDEYNWTGPDCLKGPKPAVDEFISKHGLAIEIDDNQYVIYC